MAAAAAVKPRWGCGRAARFAHPRLIARLNWLLNSNANANAKAILIQKVTLGGLNEINGSFSFVQFNSRLKEGRKEGRDDVFYLMNFLELQIIKI